MYSKKSRWLGILLLSLISITNTQAAPQLSVDTPTPTAGYFQLNWDQELPAGSVLQQSQQADFSAAQTWQVDNSEAFSMTGLDNGEYYYRVQNATDQSWSNTLTVDVQHHSLGKAWLFFSVGAVLFLYLVFYILSAKRRESASAG